MATHMAGVFTSQDLEALLSPLGRARAAGTISWVPKGPRCWIGTLPVRTTFDSGADSALQLGLKLPAPDQPNLQYLVRGVAVRRCDVNETHRGHPPFTTHKHTYDPKTGAEGSYLPDDIPRVAMGPTVPRGIYRAVFDAFAAECFVELGEGYWTEPPSAT